MYKEKEKRREISKKKCLAILLGFVVNLLKERASQCEMHHLSRYAEDLTAFSISGKLISMNVKLIVFSKT